MAVPGEGPHLELSWYSSIASSILRSATCSSSQQLSGGRPPLDTPTLMAPRVGWKRIPIALRRSCTLRTVQT